MTDLNALPHTSNLQHLPTLESPTHRSSVLARVMVIANMCQFVRDMKAQHAETRSKQKQEDHSAKYSLSRWTDGIKDRNIRALYVLTMQSIKRLTRGRR